MDHSCQWADIWNRSRRNGSAVDPGDDFFGYTNGTWFRTTEIPADRGSLGIFQSIANEVNKRNASLITEAGKLNTPEGKMVADYYKAFMDVNTIESRGLEPIKPELAEIAAIEHRPTFEISGCAASCGC